MTSANLPERPVVRVYRPPTAASTTATPSTTGGFTIRDFWRIVRGRLGLIITVLVVVTALFAGLWALLWAFDKQYTAEAYLFVEPPGRTPVMREMVIPANPQILERFQRSVAMNVLAEQIIGEALKSPTVRNTQWFRDFCEDPADPNTLRTDKIMDALQNDFRAAPVRDSNYVRVALTGRHKKEMHRILNEILNVYLNAVRQSSERDFQRELTALENQRRDITMRISELRRQLREERKNLGADIDQRTAVLRDQLVQIKRAIVDTQMYVTQTKGVYEMMQQQQQQPSPEVVEAVETHPLITAMNSRINQLKEEIKVASEEMGEDHIQVRRLKARLAAAQKELDDKRQELLVRYQQKSLNDALMAYESAKARLSMLLEQEDEISAQLKDKSVRMVDYERIGRDLEEAESMLKKIRDRYAELRAMQAANASVRVRLQIPAVEPREPSFPKIQIFIPIGVILGLLLGVGLAMLLELLDDTLRSPADVMRYLNMPVLAAIPDSGDDIGSEQLERLARVMLTDPQSVVAEAYRQLRTNLMFSSPLERQRTLLVTSCSAGCGKTTVATNLAIGMAASGRRVLLVDANMRRPALRRIFKELPSKGLSDVLVGQVSTDEAIVKTDIENLDVLGSGTAPPNPAELLGSRYMSEFLSQALKRYDQVILDGPPSLLVSDARVLATLVDGVIVVFRASVTSRGVAGRLRAEMQKVQARIIGVVLNAAQPTKGGYYRESYRSYYEYLGLGAEPAAIEQ